MKRELMLGVAACVFGALIGTVVALKLAELFDLGKYFWVVGALIGGGIAYLAGEIQELRDGISHAWKKTIVWRPDPFYWKAVGAKTLGYMASFSTFFVCFFGLLYLPNFFGGVQALVVRDARTFCGSLLLGTILLAAGAALSSVSTVQKNWYEDSQLKRRLLGLKNDGLWALVHTNPLSAAFYALYFPLKGLWFALSHIPEGLAIVEVLLSTMIKKTSRFRDEGFIAIHSERRTMRFMSASLGVAVGYFANSIMLGAVTAGLFYLMSRVLVAGYWLKTLPLSARFNRR